MVHGEYRWGHLVDNGLRPPLPFASQEFDFVYAVSVFTHLSEATSRRWVEELRRVTSAGGILLATTNGDAAKSMLLPAERRLYDSLGIIERDRFEEGKKMFLAFHSPDYVRSRLFAGWEVLEYQPASFPFVGQDTRILRR
jgi:SAM-dependent methyltransferase